MVIKGTGVILQWNKIIDNTLPRRSKLINIRRDGNKLAECHPMECTERHHVQSVGMQWKEHAIASVIALLKMRNPNLIVRTLQTNSS